MKKKKEISYRSVSINVHFLKYQHCRPQHDRRELEETPDLLELQLVPLHLDLAPSGGPALPPGVGGAELVVRGPPRSAW